MTLVGSDAGISVFCVSDAALAECASASTRFFADRRLTVFHTIMAVDVANRSIASTLPKR